MAATAPPRGCLNSTDKDYYFLCDMEADWGIVVESLATAGVVVTVILLLVLLFLICKVQDNTKRSLLPVQFLFLLGTLGIFGLTFAFIIRFNARTAPTRFFLFGVLFALCFTCLLAHAFDLLRLVRGRNPFKGWLLLVIAVSLTIVQVIIAIQYVAINRDALSSMEKNSMDEAKRKDFVLLLIYVLFLLALLFAISMFVFCGSYRRWKRHGVHICLTVLFSIGIWVVWISMLMTGNQRLEKQPEWDDPVISIALVANGWVFLSLYAVPELCFLTAPQKPGDYPPENNFCQPKVMKKNFGVENRAYAQDDNIQVPVENKDHSYVPYSTHFQLENLEPQQDFSIPRPQARPSPYQGYSGGKDVK